MVIDSVSSWFHAMGLQANLKISSRTKKAILWAFMDSESSDPRLD